MRADAEEADEEADKVELTHLVAVVVDGKVEGEDLLEDARHGQRQAAGEGEQEVLGELHEEGEQRADEDEVDDLPEVGHAKGDHCSRGEVHHMLLLLVLEEEAVHGGQHLKGEGQRQQADDHPRLHVVHHVQGIAQRWREQAKGWNWKKRRRKNSQRHLDCIGARARAAAASFSKVKDPRYLIQKSVCVCVPSPSLITISINCSLSVAPLQPNSKLMGN